MRDLEGATHPAAMDREPDDRNRIIELEDRLARTRLRRTGFPGAFVLFLVLGTVLLGDEVMGLSWGTAGFSWAFAFGSACVVGLGLNELHARRGIRATLNELEAARQPHALDPGP